jgi:hypothetical protein
MCNRKIANYLLSETHIVGKSKAKFFGHLVLTKQMSANSSKGLSILPKQNWSPDTETIFGKKYVIDGELETPNGNMIHLRTVWIIETGDDIPRLVTAHPLDYEVPHN